MQLELTIRLASIGLIMMLCLGPTLVQAQDEDLTAEQLLQSGLQLHAEGQLEEAQSTLELIDPLQLPRDQRVTLYEHLQDIRRERQGRTSVEADAAAEYGSATGEDAGSAEVTVEPAPTVDVEAGETDATTTVETAAPAETDQPDPIATRPVRPEPSPAPVEPAVVEPAPVEPEVVEPEVVEVSEPEAVAVEPAPAPQPETAAGTLQQAERALADGQLDQASLLYRRVLQDDAATDREVEVASARLADIRRMQDRARTEARQLIAVAETDLRAGRPAAARDKLLEVKASGVDLGWFDNERVDRLLMAVDEQLPAPQEPEVVEAPQPVEPAPAPQPVAPAPQPVEVVEVTPQPQPQPQPQPEPVATRPVRPAPAQAEPVEPAPQPAAPAPAPQPEPVEVVEVTPEPQPVAPAPQPEPVEVVEVTPTPRPQPAPQPVAPAPEPAPQPVAPAPQPAPAPVAQAPSAGEGDVLTQARALYAQQLVAEAREAEFNQNYRTAVTLYERALELDPNNQQITAALQSARLKAENVDTPAGILESQLTNTRLIAQMTEAEFNELMNLARAQMEERSFAQAREAVAQAKIVLDRNKRVLSSARYTTLRQEAAELAAQIDAAAADAQQQEADRIARDRDAEAKRRRLEALQQEQEEVQRLLRRALDLRREQKYPEALQLLNQALFIQPNNVAAIGMKEMIEDTMLMVRQRELLRERARKSQLLSIENTEATLPHTELMTYPSDWPRLTVQRLGAREQSSAEAELNRRIQLKLREPIENVAFEGNNLVNVIDYLRNTTGLNFYVNWNRLRDEAGIEQDTPVSLELTNVPADQALELVLQQAQLDDLNPIGYSVIRGIVTISTANDLNRATEFRTYDIRDLLVQIPSFSQAPSFSLTDALESGTGGGGGGGGGGSSASIFGDEEDSEDEEEAIAGQQIEAISTLIRDTVGRTSDWALYGGEVSSLRELNGNLIVKTTPENHNQILELLGQLRETRAIQISVEARFLLVDRNFLEEVGLDLDIQVNPDDDQWGPISIGQDSYNMTARPNTGLPGNFLTGGGLLGDFVAGQGFGATGRALDVAVSYLDDLQVNLLIRATQGSRRNTTLTAPRVTFFNGQRAYVTVARQISFISDLEPVPDTAAFDPTLEVVQSGVVLDVEGTVSSDRRYVTMTARPSLATVVQPIRTITITGAFDQPGGDGDGGGDAEPIVIEGTIEAPELELTQLSTTVSVPDKGTLLLGGQRLLAESEVEVGVPVLSKIPVLNRLFTNRTMVKDERTLLIMIKPTIIIQSEEEDNLFPGLRENPTEYNIGREL